MEEMVQNKLRIVYGDDSIVFDKSRFAGGLTNYNYIIDIEGIEYVVRQPGKMTKLMIDRKNEQINNQIASEIGINSDCIYFDVDTGIKISKYIKNSKNMAESNPCDTKNLKIVSELMKTLHFSGKLFLNSFDWKEELSKYECIVLELEGDFFLDYAEYKKQLFEFMEKNIESTISVPCHNDSGAINFIVDDKGRGYLIDWEYAGMNDPSWDLASYILGARLTEKAIHYLLLNYYKEIPKHEEILKIKCYIMAQDLLWSIWAMIKHYSGQGFFDYGCSRYDRFKKNMNNFAKSTDYPLSEMVKD